MARPRNPWIAALWSMIAPGLGHLYAGQFIKATFFLFGTFLAASLAVRLMMAAPAPPFNILLGVLVLVTFPLGAIIDAARDAHRLRDLPRPWYSRWYVCVAGWLLSVFVILPLWQRVFRTSWAQTYSLPTGSMEPTVLRGEHVLVDKAAYGIRFPGLSPVLRQRDPRRGDVVVFLFPEDRTRAFMKRVIGMPGETVEIHGRTVQLDGRPLDEPYVSFQDLQQGETRADWGPREVPTKHLFVLGDSRDNSRDSRHWGFVPVADVLGAAWVVTFSWDATEGRVRWARIGRTVQ